MVGIHKGGSRKPASIKTNCSKVLLLSRRMAGGTLPVPTLRAPPPPTSSPKHHNVLSSKPVEKEVVTPDIPLLALRLHTYDIR